MIKNISDQIFSIEKAIKWVKETESMRGAKGENAYHNLVSFRRKLKKKRFAIEGNPAAAIYGESQVGKSYLISSLLSEEGNPFVLADKNNNSYNFIEEINPPGGGSESTSLVSRFSVNYKPVDPNFPIKANLLSPKDIILVLCDSFYSDIKTNHDTILKSEVIVEELISINDKFKEKAPVQNIIEEDDILDIKDYFNNNLQKAGEVLSSGFFDIISKIVTRIDCADWGNLFSILWNKNEKITALFSELINEYQKLSFSECVYLPVDCVLYKHGTLLDVKRLKEIYSAPDKIETDYKAETEVLFFSNDRNQLQTFKKPILCALCAELVFSQPESLLKTKGFLSTTDLLDFPGARSRLSLPENLIEKEMIPELLLRGKVAYLFNKYSESEKINILLFCAKHEQAAQRAMPEMLNGWISKIVGETPEKRGEFIKQSKVPPLFIIGTFFNVNLQYNPQLDKINDDSSFKYRWNQRFVKTLSEQLLNTETYSWFTKWTSEKSNFSNIYLLRDFEKSESISHIFKGFNSNRKELSEVIPENFPDFREKLRQSFITNDFVKKHFDDPENSWDSAACMNQDGTQLIIDKLNIAASNINVARTEKAIKDVNSIHQSVISFLKEFYNNSDKEESLLKAIGKAGKIQAKLDNSFGQNPYFFGFMMRELMLNNSDVYNLYLNKIRDIERRDVINMDKYSGIRLQVSSLDPNLPFQENLESLRKHYEKSSLTECQHFFENEMGIDLNELFYGNNERVKSFYQVLANELERYWFEEHIQKIQHNLFKVLSQEDLQEIQEMLRRLFKKLEITEKIGERIRSYVDGYRNIEDVYEMISDISAEMINKFINTVGLEYYNASNFNDLEKVSENINGLSWKHDELKFERTNKQDVADLITQMGNLPELLNQNPLPKEKLKLLPNYRNYLMWYDLLKAGFVTSSGIPNYDPIANERLGLIIKDLEMIEN